MIDITPHSLNIGVDVSSAPEWVSHLLALGRRDAVFIDTAFLHALLDERDDLHDVALAHWSADDSLSYTSGFVVAEIARQMAKAGRVSQDWRWSRTEEIKRLIVDDKEILVCSPPRETVTDAVRLLVSMQRTLIRLDLTDTVSMMILDMLKHRRIASFDDHFRAVGGVIEP